MTQQDEIRLKQVFDRFDQLIEGLQAQVNALRTEVSALQAVKPTEAPVSKKAKTKEEPETPSTT